MFSSNPVQQLPSSIHVFPPTSFIDHEQKDGVHFSQHHHHHHSNQFPNGDCCYIHAYNTTLAPPPPDHKTLVSKKSGFNQYSDANSCLLESVIYQSQKKKTNMKKDGHSKIHTAQGPRDRRVRMSIEVARKFFYLQDLLGFDKASKTLDWLFTNSKTAIKELVEEMKHCSSPGVTNQCEVVFQDTLSRSRLDEEDRGQNKRLTPKCVDAKKKRKYRSEFDVNQSRAEARARARERTKEKIQNKKLDDVIPQSSFWRQVESKKEFSQRSTSESVVEQKVRISSSMLYGYQPSVLQMI